MSYRGVIFDGDDTLWSTQPLYDAAKKQFYRILGEIGIPEAQAQERLGEVDLKAVQEHGFSRHRFPASLLKTYRLMCLDSGLEVVPTIEERVQEIGYGVFESPPKIMPEAEVVLSKLRNRYRLILATKGDFQIQQEKVEKSKLSNFFQGIYILEDKSTQEFDDIVMKENLSPHQSWSVGNSLRSDINPALRVGLNAIWIALETWEYENDKPLDSHRLHIVQSLSAVLPVLLG